MVSPYVHTARDIVHFHNAHGVLCTCTEHFKNHFFRTTLKFTASNIIVILSLLKKYLTFLFYFETNGPQWKKMKAKLCNRYCIRHIFRESNFSRIGTSRHFREWFNSRWRRRAMDANQYLSFTHFQKAKVTCTVYCTTSIAYTSRIHAWGSEVNIFACC